MGDKILQILKWALLIPVVLVVLVLAWPAFALWLLVGDRMDGDILWFAAGLILSVAWFLTVVAITGNLAVR